MSNRREHRALLTGGTFIGLIMLGLGCSSSSSGGTTPPADTGTAGGDTGTTNGDTGTSTDSGQPEEVGPTDTGGDTSTGTAFAATVTDLTVDVAATGTAAHTDANLVNPWGLVFNPTAGFAWVSDNHAGVASVYDATGAVQTLVVTIPTAAGGTPPSAPTGQIFNGTATDFGGDKFILSSEDGTITGWASGTTAALKADNSTKSTIYKGLALVPSSTGAQLVATDFHNGKVDVFDNKYAAVTTAGLYADATIPTGFAPFNAFYDPASTHVFVSYAKQDDQAEDDSPGLGNGFINVFDKDGKLVKRLVSNGALNSPWGMAIAPAGNGPLAGMLVVGNFGDGEIHVYDPSSGAAIGRFVDASSSPILIEGLWALTYNTPTGGTPTLFFTAGPGSEAHGVFGKITMN